MQQNGLGLRIALRCKAGVDATITGVIGLTRMRKKFICWWPPAPTPQAAFAAPSWVEGSQATSATFTLAAEDHLVYTNTYTNPPVLRGSQYFLVLHQGQS
jgi:hypothetical protein